MWGLGQMGVAIKGPEGFITIDPCLSNSLEEQFGNYWARAFLPPLWPQQLTQLKYYLISHEHGDHLDSATVGPAAKASPQAKFIAPGWCVDILAGLDIPSERLITLPALEPLTLPGTSLRLTTVPAAHYEKEYDPQKGYRWLGFLIEWNGVTFYHAGDTIIYSDYLETLGRLPTPDIAMLPVNGRDWFRETDKNITGNLWPNEAARLARDLGWDTMIAGHNDLYPNNTIPMASIVEALANLAPRQKFKILQPGELFYYIK
jgi:L-ascorbate metabolism protein UlaG (beta-lactamase superfamily)